MRSGVRVQASSLPREEIPGSLRRCLGWKGQWGDTCFYCGSGPAKLISPELQSVEEWLTLRPDILALTLASLQNGQQKCRRAPGSRGYHHHVVKKAITSVGFVDLLLASTVPVHVSKLHCCLWRPRTGVRLSDQLLGLGSHSAPRQGCVLIGILAWMLCFCLLSHTTAFQG